MDLRVLVELQTRKAPGTFDRATLEFALRWARRALEAAGVEFSDVDGVQLRLVAPDEAETGPARVGWRVRFASIMPTSIARPVIEACSAEWTGLRSRRTKPERIACKAESRAVLMGSEVLRAEGFASCVVRSHRERDCGDSVSSEDQQPVDLHVQWPTVDEDAARSQP